MRNLLARNRTAIDAELSSIRSRKYFSAAMYAHQAATTPLILAHLSGVFIDVGCGDMPFRELIEPQVTRHDSLDIERRAPDVKYIGDIQHMDSIEAESYDSVMCLEVLEHVPDPGQAMSELHRILKEGGKLLLSVPHLSRLHEEPHDYYRFTQHGLRHLCEQAGFEVIDLIPYGGIFSFLGHQLSTVILCLVWHVPLLKKIAFSLNQWILVRGALWMDGCFDRSGLYPLGYVCAARKTSLI